MLEGLRRQYPALLRSDPLLGTDMEQFNTRVPPFNDELARQAVNYATDRNKLVQIEGGPELATPTCQLLPPNSPGYRYYCPFGHTDADRSTTPALTWSKRELSSPDPAPADSV